MRKADDSILAPMVVGGRLGRIETLVAKGG
jgi:hypothetical protein